MDNEKKEFAVVGGQGNTILTDEQVTQLNEKLEEAGKDNITSNLMRSITNGTVKPEDITPDALEEVLKVCPDDIGSLSVAANNSEEDLEYEEDIEKMLDAIPAADIPDPEVKEESIAKAMQEKYGIEAGVGDLALLKDLVEKRRNNEKVRYNDLPAILKKTMMETLGEDSAMLHADKGLKNGMAAAFIDELILGSITDEIQATYLDVSKAMSKMMEDELGPAFKEDVEVQHKFLMEELPNLADKAIEEGEEEKAEKWMKVHKAFVQSYTLEDMEEKFKAGKIKIKKIDVEKYKRTFAEFNRKYKDSKMVIHDINDIPAVLKKYLPEVDEQDILKFLVAFCKYTMNYKESNIVEHTFMYYFIYNINAIRFYKDKDAEFIQTLLGSVRRFINLINERISW